MPHCCVIIVSVIVKPFKNQSIGKSGVESDICLMTPIVAV